MVLCCPLINFWKGEIAYRNNKLDDAIKYYNAYVVPVRLPVVKPILLHVRYNLGYCLLRKENYPVALTFLNHWRKLLH